MVGLSSGAFICLFETLESLRGMKGVGCTHSPLLQAFQGQLGA